MKHTRIVQREFSKQASRFGEKGLTLSSQKILLWILESLPLDKDLRVLDVAAGTGHFSLAIAPYVREVVAMDITPAMLEQARFEATKRSIRNISFQEGTAEELPYQANQFDLVVSRLSIHHFERPILPLREMVRVCKPNHPIGIIDLLAPKDKNTARQYNDLERLRDPSHTMALSSRELEKLLHSAGINVHHREMRDVEVDFQRWVSMAGTEAKNVEFLKERLMADVGNGLKTGMRPSVQDGDLKFMQVWSIFVGIKPAE